MLDFLDFNLKLLLAELGTRGYGCYHLLVDMLQHETDSLPLNFRVVGKLIGVQTKLVEQVVMNYHLFTIYDNAFAIPTASERDGGKVALQLEQLMRDSADEDTKQLRLQKIHEKWDRYVVATPSQQVATQAIKPQPQQTEEPKAEEIVPIEVVAPSATQTTKQETISATNEEIATLKEELQKTTNNFNKALEEIQQLKEEIKQYKDIQQPSATQTTKPEVKPEEVQPEIKQEPPQQKQPSATQTTTQEQAKPKRKEFAKPTVEEITKYIKEKNYTIDPVRFWNYYESNGWKVGRNPMKSWTAAVANWNYKNKSENNSINFNTNLTNYGKNNEIDVRLLRTGHPQSYKKEWD